MTEKRSRCATRLLREDLSLMPRSRSSETRLIDDLEEIACIARDKLALQLDAVELAQLLNPSSRCIHLKRNEKRLLYGATARPSSRVPVLTLIACNKFSEHLAQRREVHAGRRPR